MKQISICTILYLTCLNFGFAQKSIGDLQGRWTAVNKLLLTDGDTLDYSTYKDTGKSALFDIDFIDSEKVVLIYPDDKMVYEYFFNDTELLIGNVTYRIESLRKNYLVLSKEFMVFDKFIFSYKRSKKQDYQ